MYLTIMHPEILGFVNDFGYGIWTPKIDGKYRLIIKASKESILTARVNKGFHFLLAPAIVGTISSVVLFTMFFDDADSPLMIRTPLLRDDDFSKALLEFMDQSEFEVFFFDENCRELLAYKAKGDLSRLKEEIAKVSLLGPDSVPLMLESAETWFGVSTDEELDAAVDVEFVEPLFPDDFFLLDADADKHQFIGAKSFSTHLLERKEPGAFQEQDIVFLLQRVFDPGRIYMNPVKDSDGEEFVDVLVACDDVILLVQAKDSPNTEKMLRTTVFRKKRKAISQLREGASQLAGAIAHAKKNRVLRFALQGNVVELDTAGRRLIGIVIVKELFNDSYREYSKIVFGAIEKAQSHVFFFDYPELNMMTLHCQSSDKFLGALQQIWSVAPKYGEFPRLRYSGKPVLVDTDSDDAR